MNGSACAAILMMDQRRAGELAAKLSATGHRPLITASSDELCEISSSSTAAPDSPAPAAHGGPAGVAGRDTPGAMAADAADPQRPKQPAVLVIEDENSVVKVIRLFLKPLGVDVLQGTGYETARDLAPSADAVLCDVHLGDENGIDVIRKLRRDGFAGPVIMVSGDRYHETVQKSQEVGISGYISKPFSKAILLEKLRQHPGLLSERQTAAVGCP